MANTSTTATRNNEDRELTILDSNDRMTLEDFHFDDVDVDEMDFLSGNKFDKKGTPIYSQNNDIPSSLTSSNFSNRTRAQNTQMTQTIGAFYIPSHTSDYLA